MDYRLGRYSALLLASLLMVVPAFGQDKPALAEGKQKSKSASTAAEKFKGQYGSHLEPILRKIQASPNQRKQISAVVIRYKPTIEPLRIEYRQKSQEFLSCIVSGEESEKVMARQGELNQLYRTIITQYSLMRLEIRRLLSPQQRVLFEEYRRQQGWSGNAK